MVNPLPIKLRPRSAQQIEWGFGGLSNTLFVRHPDGDVSSRDLTGPRGRRGRRGYPGVMPRHQWNEDRTRLRFELAPGQWGDWSADLRINGDEHGSTSSR